MSDIPPTESNVPPQSAQPEPPAVIAVTSESGSEALVRSPGADIHGPAISAPGSSVLNAAAPEAGLAPEPALNNAPASVESTSTLAIPASEPSPQPAAESAEPLERSAEIVTDPPVVIDAVMEVSTALPSSVSGEVVAPQVNEEQASLSALASVSATQPPQEPVGVPEAEPGSGSPQDAIVQTGTEGPPITASQIPVAVPDVGADMAQITEVTSTPDLQSTMASDPASGLEPEPASATASAAVVTGPSASESSAVSEADEAPDTAAITTIAPEPKPTVVERPRSDKLWFYDGNIVIQTISKQYRVHRSVLAMHSTFFRDMFELPPATAQGKQANPMLEGCPVVEVPDAADDWDAVLSIIYHTWERSDDSGEYIIPVQIMLSMLRLGHKYDFERVRNDALRQLKSIFPGDMKSCDAQFSDDSAVPVGKFSVFQMLHSFKMIATAVDLGIETILPSAYAMVLRHMFGLRFILEGRDVEDEHPVISQEIRNTIVRGDRAIMNDSYAFLFDWLRSETTPAGDECQFPENCADELSALFRRYPHDFPGVDDTSHTSLRPLTSKARHEMSGLCIPCFNAALTAYNKGRAQMFEYLPVYFMMPPWDELQDFYTR